MTTATLRPNSTVGSTGTVSGAASAHAALSDDGDSSYVELDQGELVDCNLETVAMGSGAVTKSMQMQFRLRGGGGAKNARAYSAVKNSATALSSTTYQIASGDTTIRTVSAPASPVTLSQAEVDGIEAFIDNSAGDSPSTVDVMEFYAVLVYVTQPSVSVSAVSPDPYTASTTVPIEWANTLDSDGGAQTRYEIKVYTDAEYGDGGFDPDTTPVTVYETGVVTSASDGPVDIGPIPNGDTYRAYVRVAQTVNGALHWSNWDYDTFTMDVSTAEVDTITVAAVDASGYMTIQLDWDNTSEDWEYLEVQRSIDGGTTWTPIRWGDFVGYSSTRTIGGVTVVSNDGNIPGIDGLSQVTFRDYEVPNGASVTYRARAAWYSSGLPITGSWLESSSGSWSSTATWLKVPTDPSKNTTVRIGRTSPWQHSARVGLFPVIGRALPVAVSDVMPGASFELELLALDKSELEAVTTALDAMRVLLQIPPDAGTGAELDGSQHATVTSKAVSYLFGKRSAMRSIRVGLVETDAPGDATAGQ